MMTWLRKIIGVSVLMSLSCAVLADPPPFSGVVERNDYPAAYTWVDFESGLRIVIGADMDEFCSGLLNFDLMAFQDVTIPDGRIVSNGIGEEMQTSVWDFLDFDCALFTSIDPVASGYARLRVLDNDLQGIAEGDTNTNVWTFMAHGKLEDPWGSTFNLKASSTQLFGTNTGYKVVQDVELH